MLLAYGSVAAKEATPMVEDPVIEVRLKHLSERLRCLTCQSTTIYDSRSPFADDVRAVLNEQMLAGKSDEQILAFLVQRYGDFILFDPPMKPYTLLLWFGPGLLLLFGAIVLVLVLRKRQTVSDNRPLSAADHRRAASLLQNLDVDQSGPVKKVSSENKVEGDK